MRLIILNQFFYPDHSATSQLMTDLAESLVQQQVEVTVIAGRGRYNGGERLAEREDFRGVKIVRAWSTSFGKQHLVGRLADYLSFYLGALWALLRIPPHDIVMSLTTPPLIGLVALLIGRVRRMRSVALVQDIYPDVAVALGALKPDRLTTRFFDVLNRIVLRGANRIIVLGECMRERVAAKVGADALARIDVIHNWADGTKITPLADGEANPFVIEHKLENNFVVLFSGNFGRVNEFSTVLDAARRLRERTDILFLFIGEGAKAGEIKEFSSAHKLGNVRVLPYQPRASLRYSLAAGDALLVTLADGLAGLSVPSKTYPILAAGRPVLFVGDPTSDAARLIAAHNCGAVIASGDGARLAEVINGWSSNPGQLQKMKVAARQLFEQRFDRPHAINLYIQTLTECLNQSSPREQIRTVRTSNN